ncbi:MAG: signal peptidase II [Candidatus Falkowbacteria bacterium]
MLKKYFIYQKKIISINVIIFFVIIDRFLKFLAINNFFENPIKIVGDFFKLNFVGNYNIAFSLPFNGEWLNLVISLLIFALLYNLLYFLKRKDFRKVFLLLSIVFGAISNFFDRIMYGYVIDYFDLKYFTVFNIADAMIVLGVFGLIFLGFKKNK